MSVFFPAKSWSRLASPELAPFCCVLFWGNQAKKSCLLGPDFSSLVRGFGNGQPRIEVLTCLFDIAPNCDERSQYSSGNVDGYGVDPYIPGAIMIMGTCLFIWSLLVIFSDGFPQMVTPCITGLLINPHTAHAAS